MQLLQTIAGVTGMPTPNQVLPTRVVQALSWPAHLLKAFLRLPISAELLRLAGLFFYYDTRKAAVELQLPSPRPVGEAITEAYEWFAQGSG
jgi:hypothetical protein